MSTTRAHGILLAGATLLAILCIAHHPVVAGADHIQPGTVLASIDLLRTADHIVHGGLILLLLAFAAGLSSLAQQLGQTPAAHFAALAYATGILAAIGAAAIDGFVIPDVARHFLAAPAELQQAALGLVTLCGIAIQNFSKLALLLMSAAILIWSALLLARRHRVTGAIGFVAGAAPAVLLIATGLVLRPGSLLLILGAQAAFNLAAAWLLMRAPS